MDHIAYIIIGIICIALGISHRKGNVSLMHSYHKKHVSEENLLPFGKLVGLGVIIIGIAFIISGILLFVAGSLPIIANAVLVIGLVIGFAMIFYAMKKYNNGVF